LKIKSLLVLAILFFSISCSSDDNINKNKEVDLSQFDDYELAFNVESTGADLPYEFEATFITTDEKDQLQEKVLTYSGINCCDETITVDSRMVKEYKVVGIKITPISDNISLISTKLTKISGQDTVVDKLEKVNNSVGNTLSLTFDFTTNTWVANEE